MANRGMTAAVLTEIAKGQVAMFHLVQFHFSTVEYLTDAGIDISWSGNTYISSSGFLSFGSVQETMQISVGNITVNVSGVDKASIATALLEDYNDKKIVIYRGFLDTTASIIVDPFLLFDGRISSFSVTENPGETSTLSWQVASHWADFDKVAGRRTNNNDQQNLYPGDLGLDHASEIIKDLKWGRV